MLLLARDGATEYVIVEGADPIPAEQTAAREMAEYLKRVTGAEFRVVAEDPAAKPAKAIYLGWTAFAAGKGIDCAQLGREEWALKSFGNDIVITGGRPRGTLYGVYDFLEKDIGVYWLDRDTEVVPAKADLVLKPLDRRAMPAYGIYDWHGHDPEANRHRSEGRRDREAGRDARAYCACGQIPSRACTDIGHPGRAGPTPAQVRS